jgi:DUF4097 and DUF4098 domain-containing protein YvlB
MKKLIIILIAAISFSAASAQSRNNSHYTQDRRQVTQKDSRNYNNANRSNDHAYNNNNQWKNDRDRRNAYDGMNKQYDQKINGYRNDRSLSANERDRRIREAEQERQQQSKSFGTGAIIGGVAGFLLGVLVSH